MWLVSARHSLYDDGISLGGQWVELPVANPCNTEELMVTRFAFEMSSRARCTMLYSMESYQPKRSNVFSELYRFCFDKLGGDSWPLKVGRFSCQEHCVPLLFSQVLLTHSKTSSNGEQRFDLLELSSLLLCETVHDRTS